jgi:hypothetical protein
MCQGSRYVFSSQPSTKLEGRLTLALGGLCGAVFVDEAFLEVLKLKFGMQAWDKMDAETRQRFVHDEWEHGIKQTFDGRERTWVFKMPFECIDIKLMKAGAGRPKVTLTAADVRGAFDPTVQKIRAMVDEQVAAVRVKKLEDPKVGVASRLSSLKGLRGLTRVRLSVCNHGWWLRQVQIPPFSPEEPFRKQDRSPAITRFGPVGRSLSIHIGFQVL